MIFLNKILAVTAASASVITIAANNITTPQHEIQIPSNNQDLNKEQIFIKIEKLNKDIKQVSMYYEALKSGQKDLQKQSQVPSVDDLAEEIIQQNQSIKALSDLIDVNTQDILNKHELFENLVKKSKTLEENIKLKKLEIADSTTREVKVGVSVEVSAIIQSKKAKKQDILAQKKLIRKKIASTAKKIDKKTFEIIRLQNEFNRCVGSLNNLNDTVKQTPVNKTGVLLVLNDLLSETMVDLNLSHKNLVSARQTKLQWQRDMEQFLLANISKQIEYTKQEQELKKEIKNYEKQQQTNVVFSTSSNIDQLNKSLAESENSYRDILADIDAKKAEISVQEDQNDQLHIALADLETNVKKLKQIVEEEAGQLDESNEYKDLINQDLDSLNNIRNNLIYEKHKLDRILIYDAIRSENL